MKVLTQHAKSVFAVALLTSLFGGTAQASYTNVVLSNNPIAYWRLNETNGTTLVDSSPNGRNGVWYGSPTFGVPGIPAGQTNLNTAVQFNGTDVYASAPSAPSGSDSAYTPAPTGWSANQGFSIEAWVKTPSPRAPGSENDVITRWFSSSTIATYDMYVRFDGTLLGAVRDDAGNGGFNLFGPSITNNMFHQVVLTFGHDALNNPFRKLYVDGTNYVNDTTTSLGTMSGNNYFSLSRADGGGGQLYKGVMDEVSVYATALSDATVLAHYEAGVIPEPSALMLLGVSGLLLLRRLRK